MTEPIATTASNSKTIWGAGISIFGIVVAALSSTGKLPVGANEAFTELTALVVSAVGSVVSIFGRLNPKIKPIK